MSHKLGQPTQQTGLRPQIRLTNIQSQYQQTMSIPNTGPTQKTKFQSQYRQSLCPF